MCVELHKSCKKDTALCSRTMPCHQRNLQEKFPQFKNGEISLTSALKYQRVEFVENIAGCDPSKSLEMILEII